jgi:glycosyltransferase involved in cell wall biosynthesis
MKVLTVSTYFESHRGGVELVAGRLAREFARRDCAVTWLASDASPPPADPDLRAVSVKAWNLTERRLGVPFPIPSLSALRTIAAEVGACEIVVAHDALYLTTLIAVIAAARARKPVLVVQHIGAIPYRNPILRWLMRAANALLARPLLARAAQVVFISETTAAFFATVRFRAPPRSIFNGVDTEMFRPADPSHAPAAREEFQLRRTGVVALFVGRFVEKKGLAILRDVAASRGEVTFAFAGWGLIDPAGWDLANVRVFGGLSGETLASLYRAADLLVLPSRGEGFPLVVQEALAAGLKVVCGAETVAADPAAAPFLAGVDLADGDAVTLARRVGAAIDAALDDAADDRVARHAFAAEHYSWSAAGEAYLALMRPLLSPAIAGVRPPRAGRSRPSRPGPG